MAKVEVFSTFPLPYENRIQLIGENYHSHRETIMLHRQEGLTSIYNHFHDPFESQIDVNKLRKFHVEMDQAVAAAYGWRNIDLGHGFHDTKQGIRYTISETARREVLDRLLELNHQRYAEEVAAGLHDKKPAQATGRRMRGTPSAPAPMDDLFANPAPEHPKPLASGVDGASPILAFLQAHPGWHGKDSILTATGFPENLWTVAIKDLLESGQVERQGEKRGARYRIRDTYESG